MPPRSWVERKLEVPPDAFRKENEDSVSLGVAATLNADKAAWAAISDTFGSVPCANEGDATPQREATMPASVVPRLHALKVFASCPFEGAALCLLNILRTGYLL